MKENLNEYKDRVPLRMKQSPLVSYRTRSGLLKNMHYRKGVVPMDKIIYVAQPHYNPDKVKSICSEPEVLDSKPIDVLWDSQGDEYHVIDGHHRFLAARRLGKSEINAHIRRKAMRTYEGKDNKSKNLIKKLDDVSEVLFLE